ncbi:MULTISPECIES: hypothetical protein [unclassified Nonomuraea]|uniref:hypothetical protein n=1 Tax=unclassified Nonomuraea TaxID=2593643 RepID=UPI0033F90588
MSDPGGQGYKAVFSGLRQRSAQADSSLTALWSLRDVLQAAFYREGNPLGDDHYGAELEKNRYKIEDAVIGAFDRYYKALADIRDGLRDSARNYEDAEGYGDPGGDDPGYPGSGGEGAPYPPLDGQVPPRGDMPAQGDDPSLPMLPGR